MIDWQKEKELWLKDKQTDDTVKLNEVKNV